MWQKYILLIAVLFISINVQGQLYMDLYNSIGADTSIQCMDASNGYSISNTSIWVGTYRGLFHLDDYRIHYSYGLRVMKMAF